MEELAFAGVARQAELVRSGEVTPRELVELCLERIARLDPQLNAFRIVFRERALAEADQAQARANAGEQRPLLGVPLADQGQPRRRRDVTTHGTEAFGAPPSATPRSCGALREAGAIVIGRTTCPGCARGVHRVRRVRGSRATRGTPTAPRRLERRLGAAVAAGLVPAALGATAPARSACPSAFCGLFGLKAQRGRVSLRRAPSTGTG